MYDDVGARIRLIRQRMDKTIDEFSELVNISSSFLSDVELGKSGISSEKLIRICKKCNVSANYILLGIEDFGEVPSNIVEILKEIPPKYNVVIYEMIKNVAKTIKLTADEYKE